jgi:hypothetical protein
MNNTQATGIVDSLSFLFEITLLRKGDFHMKKLEKMVLNKLKKLRYNAKDNITKRRNKRLDGMG